MSTVYRAFDETLEREVAIKIMHSDISSDEAALERFRREARTVAQLSHPHVVMVIDAGEDEGHPTSSSSTSAARRSRTGSAARARCRSRRRSRTRSRSAARCRLPTSAGSCTAT